MGCARPRMEKEEALVRCRLHESLGERLRRVGLVLVAISWSFCAGANAASPVRCLPIDDGDPIEALAVQAIAAGQAILVTPEGRRRIEVDALRRIEFVGRRDAPGEFALKMWARRDQVFMLEGLEGDGNDRVTLKGEGWEAADLSLLDVRGVAGRDFLAGGETDEQERFERALRSPPREADLVAVEANGRTRLLRGRVGSLAADGVRMAFERSDTLVPWPRVRWLVLSALPGRPEAAATRYRLSLTDGSRIEALGLAWERDEVTAASGETTFRLSADVVARIEIDSERCRYLSRLEPAEVRLTPFFDVAWQPRMDRCVNGGPLVLGGRVYETGIGMGTRTEMTFNLGGFYTHFYAAVGVDDSAGERGRVVFRLLADGAEVFRSPVMRGSSAPLRVSLPLAGADTLTLVSDFGSELRGEGNLADWAEARVVRLDAPARGPERPATPLTAADQ